MWQPKQKWRNKLEHGNIWKQLVMPAAVIPSHPGHPPDTVIETDWDRLKCKQAAVDDRLCDGQSLVEVAKCIDLPFLQLWISSDMQKKHLGQWATTRSYKPTQKHAKICWNKVQVSPNKLNTQINTLSQGLWDATSLMPIKRLLFNGHIELANTSIRGMSTRRHHPNPKHIQKIQTYVWRNK